MWVTHCSVGAIEASNTCYEAVDVFVIFFIEKGLGQS